MKLPRDLSGEELARHLARYGCQVVRQTGSHLRLVSVSRGTAHRVTIPSHRALWVGTLNAILREIAAYLEIDRERLVAELFERG